MKKEIRFYLLIFCWIATIAIFFSLDWIIKQIDVQSFVEFIALFIIFVIKYSK